MTVKVFITIDTEEDDWGDFRTHGHGTENIAQIPLVQEIFDRYGAIPTYLVSHAVATDERAVRTLKGILHRGRCEIGAHCHPWNTPPFGDGDSLPGSMLSALKPETVAPKIQTLHNVICDAFGFSPISFRAGRWALGPYVAKGIMELGYKVDTSVTPFINWARDGGPDFSTAPTQAYRFDPESVMVPKKTGRLLQLPATIGFYQRPFELCASLRNTIAESFLSRFHVLGALDRMKLLNLRWLSPETSSAEEMVRLSKTLISRGCNYLNLSFHSTSLLPGKSPFVKDQSDLSEFIMNIERFLRFTANEQMVFSALSDGEKLFAKGPSEEGKKPTNKRNNK